MSNATPEDYASDDSLSDVSVNDDRAPLQTATTANIPAEGATVNGVPKKIRKIRKERKAYHKIDDNIRLQLLEATRNGETLKSAAKRFQVNYSSAKSIFYTFRKEGRILKKINQEKGPNYETSLSQSNGNNFIPSLSLPALPTQDHSLSQKIQQKRDSPLNIPRLMDGSEANKHENGNKQNDLAYIHSLEDLVKKEAKQNNPLLNLNMQQNFPNELTNLSNMQNLQNMQNMQNMQSMQSLQNMQNMQNMQNNLNLNNLNNLNGLNNLNNLPFGMNNINNNQMMPNNQLAQLNMALKDGLRGSMSALTNNANMLKNLGNFNQNHLAATAASTEVKEEFDDMGGMAQRLQQHNFLQGNNLNKGNSLIPDIMQPELPTFGNNDLIKKLILNDGSDFSSDIQDIALDAYKSFIDAQMHLSNAMTKASYLNNLVQIQQMKGVRSMGAGANKIMGFQ